MVGPAAPCIMWPADFIPCFTNAASNLTDPLCFGFIGDGLLLAPDHNFPRQTALEALPTPSARFVFGHLADRPCLALRWTDETQPGPALLSVPLRAAFELLPDGYWDLAARARQMLGWDLATRFCGACGQPTVPAETEPAKHCPACGHRTYTQIAPAIMCLVHRGNELLLARSPHFRPGMYSALAGFVETGESIEACVHREVFEETGIRIRNLRWFASQPWPFPNSLMLAFHADYAGGEIVCQPGEIEDAGWFSLDTLPERPASVSIASRLIAAGIAELRQSQAR